MKNTISLALFGIVLASYANAQFAPFSPAVSTQQNLKLLQQQEFDEIKEKDLKRVEEIKKKEEKAKETEKKSKPAEKHSDKSIKEGVFIKEIKMAPSDILTEAEIDLILNPLLNKKIQFSELQDAIKKINELYASKGFVTARAFIPEQKIKDGIVKIDIIEGRVGNLEIKDNRWTRSSYIEQRMSQKPDTIFDISKFEKDINTFNLSNSGVNVNATLEKGEKFGTTDIILNTKETLPYKITGIIDNAGRDSTGNIRGGLVGQADSLFGYRDMLSIGSYISEGTVTPFFDYNFPINRHDAKVGVSYSSSISDIIDGPFELYNIESESDTYSLYYTYPIIRDNDFNLNGYASANYKHAKTTYSGVEYGSDDIFSIQASINTRKYTENGVWYGYQDIYYATPSDNYSGYVKLSGGGARLHNFGNGVIGQLRGNYQYIPQKNVPFLDQFQSGGMATVRGYSEGLLIGKSGYFLSGELNFPIIHDSYVNKEIKENSIVSYLDKNVQGIVFVDHAGVFPYRKGASDTTSDDFLLSAGVGLKLSLPMDITAKLYWGFPIIDNKNEDFTDREDWGKFNFEIILTPDFNELLMD